MHKKSLQMLVGIVVIIVVAGGAYAIFHKSSKSTAGTSQSSAYGSATTTPKASSQSSAKSATSTDIIQTKTDASVGQYLADGSGNALYTYGSDTQGKSNCDGSCLYTWPVYAVTQSTTSLPANVTVITRSDGSKQYAYKGLPLYTFTSDSTGKVTGDNVSDFHVAKP